MSTHIAFTLSVLLAGNAALTPALAQQFVISTVAGNTAVGTTPVPGVNAAIGTPMGIAADSGGNVYFSSASAAQNLVLKLDPSGVLTRIAGGLQKGFSGDGGPAGAALFDSPKGLATDGLGNLYIADSNNHRVRKVSPSGIIATVAGNGSAGASGDGGPALEASLDSPSLLAADRAGNLYIAAPSRIRKVSPDGIITTIVGNGSPGDRGDGGLAIDARIGRVSGLAADSAGSLYFSDTYYKELVDDFGEGYTIARLRVRRVSPDGIITTVAGNGNAGYSGDGGLAIEAQLASPGALAVDSGGNLYVADGAVRKVSVEGIITTVAGDRSSRYIVDAGPATSAGAVFAAGMAVDPTGNLYIADHSQRIRKVSPAGIIATVAGLGPTIGGIATGPGDGGPAVQAPLNSPAGVVVDGNGVVYIADTFDNRIRRVSQDGTITTVAGKGAAGVNSGDGGPASDAYLFWPAGLAVDGGGNLYIADSGDSRIRMISPAGIITTVAGLGLPGRPGYSGDGGPATAAQLSWPKDVAFDGSGNLFIADTGNNRIRKISGAGIITTVAGTGDFGYSGDTGAAASARFAFPSGLTLDGTGNIFVADTHNFRVRRISPSGIVTTIAGDGTKGSTGDGGPATGAQLNYPTGIKLDSAGNLYIGDGGAVRRVSPSGIITTVAGTGVPGYSGDGGAATGAQLGAWGLAFDRAGKLYVTDPSYNTVRLLTPVQ